MIDLIGKSLVGYVFDLGIQKTPPFLTGFVSEKSLHGAGEIERSGFHIGKEGFQVLRVELFGAFLSEAGDGFAHVVLRGSAEHGEGMNETDFFALGFLKTGEGVNLAIRAFAGVKADGFGGSLNHIEGVHSDLGPAEIIRLLTGGEVRDSEGGGGRGHKASFV